ncbi:hypothetical protein CRYUN_Cryun16bG0111800 [Craigia yunnanensis]
MGRLLAQHSVTVTIFTTSLNAVRFKSIIDRDITSGIQIRLLQLRFPCIAAGLPEGCENQPLEQSLEETQPKPSCVISGRHLPWTFNAAQKFKIPRLVFYGTSCFTVTCSHFIGISKIHEKFSDDVESFVEPGLLDRIELTKTHLPIDFNPGSLVLKDKEEHERQTCHHTVWWLILLKNWNRDMLKNIERQK